MAVDIIVLERLAHRSTTMFISWRVFRKAHTISVSLMRRELRFRELQVINKAEEVEVVRSKYKFND